jgi:hypothetical protein
MTLLPDNATLPECVIDCVPEGFWALCATSFAVMLLMTVVIVWIASPRLFCQCCSSMRRGMAEIQSGVRQTLLEARGRTDDDNEPVWTQQPQTRREIELVDLQKKRREQAEKEEAERLTKTEEAKDE